MREPTAMLRTLTRVACALDDAGVEYALTGGCAVYARGGPPSDHDVDVLVRPESAADAVEAMRRMFGMRPVEPEESWLTKVYDGDWLVDVIYRPNENTVSNATLARAERLRVGPASMPVMPATYLLTDKILVLGPHRCDFAEPLQWARSLREQIDWEGVRRATSGSPYAEAFLWLCRRLDLVPAETTTQRSAVMSLDARSQYVAERLSRVLAQDPEIGELGVSVEADGDELRLVGVVSSHEQHAHLVRAASDHSEGHRIRDEIRVVATVDTSAEEDVS